MTKCRYSRLIDAQGLPGPDPGLFVSGGQRNELLRRQARVVSQLTDFSNAYLALDLGVVEELKLLLVE